MKKKGFTLIELLAVIVVLAIIALIATPIVMNVIKNAGMGAAERSADNYVKAVETLIATEKLDGNSIANGSYTITSTGKLTIDGKDYEVEVSGTKPVGGTIKIENGQVIKDSSTVNYKDYTVTFENGVAKAEAGEAKALVGLADVCNFLENDTHNEGRNPNTVGAKYTSDLGSGARTFYVLEVGTASKPATLILEGNYDENIFTLYNALNLRLDEIAEVWTKIDRSQIDIPSILQILTADDKNEPQTGERLSNDWLYSWPDNPSWNDYAIMGYWTKTTLDSDATNVWSIETYGYVTTQSAGYVLAVRPIVYLDI